MILPTYTVKNAKKIPHATPAKTSVGKCTYKYILENAINDANVSAAQPKRRSHLAIIVAATNEENVCPEGKEKPRGISIKSDTFAIWQGRGRQTMFLMI